MYVFKGHLKGNNKDIVLLLLYMVTKKIIFLIYIHTLMKFVSYFRHITKTLLDFDDFYRTCKCICNNVLKKQTKKDTTIHLTYI